MTATDVQHRAPGRGSMTVTDPDLHDPDLLEEIELLGELVIAASGNDGLLAVERIDAILGLKPDAPEQSAAGPDDVSKRE